MHSLLCVILDKVAGTTALCKGMPRVEVVLLGIMPSINAIFMPWCLKKRLSEGAVLQGTTAYTCQSSPLTSIIITVPIRERKVHDLAYLCLMSCCALYLSMHMR